MGLYPVILNLEGRSVTVIGGGEVALRKIRDLVDAGAKIKIVSPDVHHETEMIAEQNPVQIELVRRPYREGDLEGAALAFSATSDPSVNRQVFEEAERRGIFINAVDDPSNCSFIVPSVTRNGDFLLAVSTAGASPAMAARLRRLIEQAVPENVGAVLEALKEARHVLMNHENFQDLDTSARGEILKRIAYDDGLLVELVEAKKEGALVVWLSGRRES